MAKFIQKIFICSEDCRHWQGEDGCNSPSIDLVIDRMVEEGIEFSDDVKKMRIDFFQSDEPTCPLFQRINPPPDKE